MDMTLDCSSDTGTYITDKTAFINFFGLKDNIFNIYMNARRNANGEVAKNDLAYFDVGGVKFDISAGASFYNALWWQFFKDNPSICEGVRRYDAFDDNLDIKLMNSTARVFTLLKNFGLKGLFSNCKAFLIDLKEKRKDLNISKPDAFSEFFSYVRKLVKSYQNKNEVLDFIKSSDMEHKETAVRLVHIIFNEMDGNCSKEYADLMIRNIRIEFERENSVSNNSIVLE